MRFKTAGLGEMTGSFGQNQFDLLLCLGNSLPHLTSEQELIVSLQDFHSSLRPGGMLFIQNRNFDMVHAASRTLDGTSDLPGRWR